MITMYYKLYTVMWRGYDLLFVMFYQDYITEQFSPPSCSLPWSMAGPSTI